MNLHELNSLIHSATKTELLTNLSAWKASIKNLLITGTNADEHYYENHIGRELFRKLYNFDLESEIKDDYDSGFRPISVKKWNPLSTIPIVAWYDASDSSTITNNESNKVTAWADKSGNSNDLTGQDNPITGVNTQNSLNVIDLDGDDYFERDNFSTPASADLQAFIVCKVTTVDNNADSIMSMDASSNDWQIGAGNHTQFRGILTFNDQTPHGSTTVGSNAGISGFHIFCADLDFTDDGEYQLFVDGETLPGTYVRNYTSELASNVEFYLFANRQRNRFPEGAVAEVILLDSTSDTDRQKVEGYLAHKWGLVSELPVLHPYKDLEHKTLNP